MKAFTIDADQNICFYNTKKEAIQKAESDNSLAVFTSQDELDAATKGMPVGTLAEIFNSFTGVTEVKTFPSRKAGINRIWAECRKMTQKGPHLVEAETAEETATSGPEAAHVEAEGAEANATPFDESASASAKIGNVTFTGTPEEIAEVTTDKPYLPKAKRAPKSAKPAKVAKAAKAEKKTAAPKTKVNAHAPREGSKTAQVIAMLKKPGGATLAEIMKRFDWQQHTTRALMSAGGSLAKKHGITVKSEKGADGGRVFSISA